MIDLGITQEELEAAALKVGVEPQKSTLHSAVEEALTPEPEPAIVNGAFTLEEVVTSCRNSPDFLAAMAMPETFQYFLPPHYIEVWNYMVAEIAKKRSFPQIALGLPRGFAKTTLIRLFVLYCILFTEKQYIVIFNKIQDLAIKSVTAIASMLKQPNIIAAFGDYRLGLEIDQQAKKIMGYRGRRIILEAIGAGGTVRGTNEENLRPDVMVFDDIQDRDDADSEVVSKKLEDWLYGTAMKAKSPHGCMYIFLANMYPTKWSLLKRMKKSRTWVKFIVGGILADGTSLWEELQPIEQLIVEYERDKENGKEEIFFAEVLNDENASLNTKLNLSDLPEYNFHEDELALGKFIVIDPATNKAHADDVSIGQFDILERRNTLIPVMKHVDAGIMSPGNSIKRALLLALQTGTKVIAIESNAYQYTLKYWMDKFIQQLGLTGFIVIDIYSGTKSKNSRIVSMFSELRSGELYYHPRTKAQVESQITQFNPAKTDNTDGILDLLTYAPRIVGEYKEQIIGLSELGRQEASTAKVLTVEENSLF